MKKLLFIYNPHSGKEKIKSKLSDIIESFVAAQYEVTVYSTRGKEDATSIIMDCCSRTEYDVVACSGGDGTLNEIICGVMQLEKRPAIGYIPSGTTNDFASSLRIHKDMYKAAETVSEGRIFPCDIGEINERFFTYVVGFGAFTEVSYETSQAAKNTLGRLAYILEGAKRLTSLKSYHIIIEYDGITIEDDFIYGMISNSESIGGFKLMGKREVSLNDGLFEIFMIRMPKNLIDLQSIINSLLMEKENEKYIFTASTSQVTLRANEPISLSVDGEFGGAYDTIHIKNYKHAVEFLVPENEV